MVSSVSKVFQVQLVLPETRDRLETTELPANLENPVLAVLLVLMATQDPLE